MAEIVARAKTSPIHLEANVYKWGVAKIEVFERHLEVHVSQIRSLCIRGHFQTTLQRLVSSAPTLESLFLSHYLPDLSPGQIVIPVNFFNCTAPSLTSLVLECCDISWKSPLLKGLRSLKIIRPSAEARPGLKDWLDALNEMPQLETLSLEYASPSVALAASLISGPSRTVTLPFLTRFHIFTSANDYALALVHLELPALTWLRVDAESVKWEGEDVRLLIPYVARYTYALQSTKPLRGFLVCGRGNPHVDIVARTKPDANLKVNEVCASAPVCLIFVTSGILWHREVETAILDALLNFLPVSSASTLLHRMAHG
jgi:hypothetical protein